MKSLRTAASLRLLPGYRFGGHHSRLRWLLLLAAAAASALPLAAQSQQAPVFELPTTNSPGKVQLALTGDLGATYVVEVATNLSDWTPMLTNTMPTGHFEFTDVLAGSVRFYRARLSVAGAEGPPTVIATPDPSQRVTTLVTPAGGFVSLLDPAGILYTLSFPSNAVIEAVEVSMTLVTNLVGQPFADTNWSAVVFEPSGLEFLEPGQLTIQHFFDTLDTNVASFCFAGDGTDFALLPDRLFPDRVEFDVYHFSGAGAARMTPAEYQRQAQQQVHQTFDQVSQQIGTALKPLRDAGMLPLPGLALPSDIAARLRSYLDEYISSFASLESKFLSDCDYLSQAMPAIRSVFTMSKKYRLPESTQQASFRAIACAAITRCSQELVTKCKGGNTDVYQQLKAWELISAIPLKCATIPDQDLKGCLPGWYGFFSFTQLGQTTNNPSGDPQDFKSSFDYYQLGFYAVVTNATAFPPNPILPFNVTLDFLGTLSGSYHNINFSSGYGGCEGNTGPNANKYVTLKNSSGFSSAPATCRFAFYQMINSPLAVTFVPPSPLSVDGQGYTYGYYSDCSGKVLVNTNTPTTKHYDFSLPYMPYPNGDFTITTNQISWEFKLTNYVSDALPQVIGSGLLYLWPRPD